MISPNLVAIAGAPADEVPSDSVMRALRGDDIAEDKRAMWMALAALGVGAVIGYTLFGDMVRRPS